MGQMKEGPRQELWQRDSVTCMTEEEGLSNCVCEVRVRLKMTRTSGRDEGTGIPDKVPRA